MTQFERLCALLVALAVVVALLELAAQAWDSDYRRRPIDFAPVARDAL